MNYIDNDIIQAHPRARGIWGPIYSGWGRVFLDGSKPSPVKTTPPAPELPPVPDTSANDASDSSKANNSNPLDAGADQSTPPEAGATGEHFTDVQAPPTLGAMKIAASENTPAEPESVPSEPLETGNIDQSASSANAEPQGRRISVFRMHKLGEEDADDYKMPTRRSKQPGTAEDLLTIVPLVSAGS